MRARGRACARGEGPPPRYNHLQGGDEGGGVARCADTIPYSGSIARGRVPADRPSWAELQEEAEADAYEEYEAAPILSARARVADEDADAFADTVDASDDECTDETEEAQVVLERCDTTLERGRMEAAVDQLQVTLSRTAVDDLLDADTIESLVQYVAIDARSWGPPPSDDVGFMRRLMLVDVAGALMRAVARSCGPGGSRLPPVASRITDVLDAMAASAADSRLATPLARCFRRMVEAWSPPRQMRFFVQAFGALALELQDQG